VVYFFEVEGYFIANRVKKVLVLEEFFFQKYLH